MKENYSPVRRRDTQPQDRSGLDAIEKFRAAPVKVAVQKGGSITDLSRDLLRDQLGINVPEVKKGEKVMVGVTENDEIGYMYARNKDLTNLVRNGVVDFAIVGSDRVLEEHAEQDVQIADIYRDHTWPIVLATRPDTEADELKDFQTVATSYPRITREAFRRAGNDDVNIIQTSGGTELYAYLEYGGMPVDAISDLTETGNSLRAHGLDRWDPPLFHVSPTLITAKDSDILELFDANLPRKEREIEDPQTIFDASLLPSGDRRQ